MFRCIEHLEVQYYLFINWSEGTAKHVDIVFMLDVYSCLMWITTRGVIEIILVFIHMEKYPELNRVIKLLNSDLRNTRSKQKICTKAKCNYPNSTR